MPHAPLFACGMTYAGAAVGIGIAASEWRSHEQAGNIGYSMTVDITDTVAAGAQPAVPGLPGAMQQAACTAAAHLGHAPELPKARRGPG